MMSKARHFELFDYYLSFWVDFNLFITCLLKQISTNMFRPWLSKYKNLSTNEDHFQNDQNETYEENLDDFTLYLSDVSH